MCYKFMLQDTMFAYSREINLVFQDLPTMQGLGLGQMKCAMISVLCPLSNIQKPGQQYSADIV